MQLQWVYEEVTLGLFPSLLSNVLAKSDDAVTNFLCPKWIIFLFQERTLHMIERTHFDYEQNISQITAVLNSEKQL